MNDTTLLQLFHHINKRHNIRLETKEISTCTCNCEEPVLPSGCDQSEIISITESAGQCCESYLSSLNNNYSRICTSDCAGAIVKYYHCLAADVDSEDDDDAKESYEYIANYVEKYVCGKESGDYCPVKLIRSFSVQSNVEAYNMLRHVCLSSNTCNSTSSTSCTSALRTFSSAAGCCTEPLFGSGVSSCGVSIPDACAGLSSATGIIATPIVGVSLMILALAGVFL